jgi:AcrR family transcriptional regulator
MLILLIVAFALQQSKLYRTVYISARENRNMARRGEKLREHILWTAKEVFLEVGFERASMDGIAARAETSKRTLYSHFENKEKLYLAVVELLRGLVLAKLKTPAEYTGTRAEKLATFCGRYLQMLLYDRCVQMCRLSIAEAARFPVGTVEYFEVIFTTPRDLLSSYLKSTFKLSTKASVEAADELIGRALYPRFTRALFGLEQLYPSFDDEAPRPDFDLKPIRKAVAEFLKSMT